MEMTAILSSHESSRLEFKTAFPENERIAATLCAFANTAGGDLIIGIRDRTNEVVGINEDLALDYEERIASLTCSCIAPMIVPIIKIIRHEGKVLIAVHIDMGYQRPYRVIHGKNAGKVFVRIGSTTRAADSASIEMMELQAKGLSLDCLPCLECTAGDLDKNLISEFLELRRYRRGIPAPSSIGDPWLRKMKLIVEVAGIARPTLGGVVLFCRKPQEIVPQSMLEMARFVGTQPRDFIDRRSPEGPLWKLYDEALLFLKRHIPVMAKRQDREMAEQTAYPEIAFREFMINALCHRTYKSGSGPTRLAIFEHALEITNPGTLPEGLELEDVGTGISVIRNPLIARIFSELGLIEGWGTGIQIAQNQLAERGLPRAELRTRGFFLQVASSWKWPEDLTGKERAVIQRAAASGIIVSRDVMKILACSERSARGYLERLVRRGLLKKRGSTRGAEYFPA